MNIWKALKTAGKATKEGLKARQQAKQERRERRLAALSAVITTFKTPIIIAVVCLGVLVFLFFAPPESKKALMDFIKFFTG